GTILFSILAPFGFCNTANAAETLVINELMASNGNSEADPQGQYDDWIEIHNYGTNTVNMGGMYLTDDLSVRTKWRIPNSTTIPAGGYLLIWADEDIAETGLHANFKLSADGEQIALYDSDGITPIDSIAFNAQKTDISYGRYPDAGNQWQFFVVPSPGEENQSGYSGIVEDTKFSQDRGFYDIPFSVTISTGTPQAIIRYTTDGSTPTETYGRIYTGPVQISTTTCLRAMAHKTGWMPTNVDTHTYIFLDDVIVQPQSPPGFPVSGWGHAGPDYEMDPVVVDAYSDTIKDDMKSVPTVSLVMNEDDWFGSKGIYVNESQDGTERVVSMEYIDPNSGDDFQINCAISMQGGVSGGGTSLDRWKSDKLSMRPRFKTTTDDGTPTGGPTKLNYKIFDNSPTDTFDTVVLDARLGNAWNYGGGSTDHGTRPWISGRPIYQPDLAQYTRDQFVADIQNALGGYSHYGRHVHLYINGLYWGLYNLHERPDHRFAAAYMGGNADDYDCLKHNSGEIINGSNTTFNQMMNIAESGLVSNDNYQLIQQYLDVDNFINYLIPHYYVGDWDWGHKNWYATRNAVDPNGRWRFHHWDGEHLMEDLNEDSTGRDNAGGPTRLHNRLAQNAEYRLLFADHVHRYFFNDGFLTPEGAAALYRIRLDDVDRAVVGESARWGDNQIDRFAHIRYMREPHWLLERTWLLGTYFPKRTDIVLKQFKNRGWYPNIDAPVFHINGSYQHGGQVTTNSSFSITNSTGTVFYTLDGSDPRQSTTMTEPDKQFTLVAENSDKRVLVPAGPVSDNWKGGGAFSDSAWISGTGGVGFEAASGYQNYFRIDLYDQMYQNQPSCYIRIPFNVTQDMSRFNVMTFRILYDDGFIAYINGVEIARRNFNGTPGFNSSADTTHSDSEAVNFENIDVSSYINTIDSGENILAIQGLNVSSSSSDFLISAELVATESGSNSDEGLSSNTHEYTGPITLTESVHIKSRVLSGNTWSALNEATYAVGPVAENLRITELMYHPENDGKPDDPNEEFIELTNISSETINLNLVKFTNGINFTFPSIELAAGEYIVVVQDKDAFETKYGSGINIAGQYAGKLDNAGERIRLEDAAGQTILDFSYKDGWYDDTDGEGFSLKILNPANSDPDSWGEKESWQTGTIIGGSPGSSD
ncbi:MAG: lamin tail domain-containing protein, partial [Sedimentisphaerales bacterium]|nr:lamin tail domain-containing protein [Sedimentisphaerales bacterium]